MPSRERLLILPMEHGMTYTYRGFRQYTLSPAMLAPYYHTVPCPLRMRLSLAFGSLSCIVHAGGGGFS
eukprot:5072842-Prymnesium_polylepis.1